MRPLALQLTQLTQLHVRATLECPAICSMPRPPALPAGTRYLPGVPAATPAWYCPSGHILVRPTINGRQAGYMMLDTGAQSGI
jgi:hypothetical protein